MTYLVTKSNGQIQAVIKDGTIDTSTSLKLYGKNSPNYGQNMAENMLHLLENFANTTAPTQPIKGQVWFNSSNSQLNVYDGVRFTPLAKSTVSNTAPTAPNTGDGWWDTATKLFKIYDGTAWQAIGPEDLSNYAQLTQDNSFTGNIGVGQTLTVGTDHLLSATMTPSGQANLRNLSAGKDLVLGVTLSTGADKPVLTISGATGQAEVAAPESLLAIANKQYVDSATSAVSLTVTEVNTRVTSVNDNLVSSIATLATGIAGLQQEKANISSPALTGTPTVPTPALNTTSKQIVNAEFVQNNLLLKANVNSPEFLGTPRAPTATVENNSTQLATTAFVKNHCGSEVLHNATLTGSTRAITLPGSDNSTGLATTAFVHGILPRGTIVMWSGTNTPAGWALCDGTNGTPDLRNKFIVGAGGKYTAGATGGAESSSGTTTAAGAHNHSGATAAHALTVDQMPSHTHPYVDTYFREVYGNGQNYGVGSGAGDNDNTDLNYNRVTSAAGGNQGHTHGITGDPGHTHSIAPITTVPPYYAMAYIMKVY